MGALATLSQTLLDDTLFDVVFLDEHYTIDGLKGLDVTRQYRQLEADRAATPALIVGVTGNADIDGHTEKALAAGQDLVFGKPIPSSEQITKLISGLRPRLIL